MYLSYIMQSTCTWKEIIVIKYGLFALLLCSSAAWAASDFEGSYNCKGHDPYENKDYSGHVTVTHTHAVYQLEMNYGAGVEMSATGGQYDPTLMSVVFQDKKDLKRVGLEQYKFADDKKKMQGYWVYLGGEKLGTEVCERV
jgi:hypothetical protein